MPIAEFIRENSDNENYFRGNSEEMAEIRRICEWFLYKFQKDVMDQILYEKLIKFMFSLGSPDSKIIRNGIIQLEIHLSYLEKILSRQQFIAGDIMTIADFMAASYLSCVDYIGTVNWVSFPEVKLWYSRMKSRPSMDGILEDLYMSMPPGRQYKNVDF